MRILYFVYAPYKSINGFIGRKTTNFPWVDSMLVEIARSENIIPGLALPVSENIFEKNQLEGLTIYGLPDNNLNQKSNKLLFKKGREQCDLEILFFAQKAIDDFQPDIIQIFGTENIFGLMQSKVRVPTLIHFQGSVQVVSMKWFTGITRYEQFIFSPLKNLIYKKGSYYEYFRFNKRGSRESEIIGDCKYFLGRTTFDRRLIALFSPNAKYFHCEEFLRKEFYNSQWNVPLSETISFISVLKGVTYKGIDLLIDTIALLLRYTELNFTFKICGVRETEEVVALLKRKYQDDSKMARVRFLGKLDTETLIEELKASNIFVHPSYMENSSNSICEAMALGMPVIATNVGGTSSLIEDGMDGILVQEGEPFSLAGAIIELIRNYDNAIKLGQNARKRSINRHDPDTLRNTMLKIYQDIVGC